MADIFPVGVSGTGTTRIQSVETIANPAAPIITEINAASALDVTPYFRVGAVDPSMTQPTLDDTRLSDVNARTSFGPAQWDWGTPEFVWDPQAADDDPGNMAFGVFEPGTSKFLVVRYGILASTAFAAAQKVWVWSVTYGARAPRIPGSDQNAKHTVRQPMAATLVAENVAITSS